MPLVAPFGSSAGSQDHRDVLLVRVEGPDGEGWGECVAMNEPRYTSEYADGAAHVTAQHLVPLLLSAGEVTAGQVAAVLAPVRGHPMAKAAVELAVLDAELRAAGTRLADHLGGVRAAVDAGVSVGIAPSVGALLDEVGGYLSQGYRRVKLKVEPGWDLEPVAAVRERFGDDVLLQVDANGAYSLGDAERLARLDPFGLLMLEQPLPEDDLAGHAELARRIATPICLDESITSARSTVAAIDAGACAVVNVKAGRVGGYLEAVRIHDVCIAREVPVWCGGMLETGLGRAANVALAALPGFSLPGDLSASDRYFARDVAGPFTLVDGQLAVPTGPGLGVEVDRAALDAATTSVDLLRPW